VVDSHLRWLKLGEEVGENMAPAAALKQHSGHPEQTPEPLVYSSGHPYSEKTAE
jgi:hypothetical protein